MKAKVLSPPLPSIPNSYIQPHPLVLVTKKACLSHVGGPFWGFVNVVLFESPDAFLVVLYNNYFCVYRLSQIEN